MSDTTSSPRKRNCNPLKDHSHDLRSGKETNKVTHYLNCCRAKREQTMEQKATKRHNLTNFDCSHAPTVQYSFAAPNLVIKKESGFYDLRSYALNYLFFAVYRSPDKAYGMKKDLSMR